MAKSRPRRQSHARVRLTDGTNEVELETTGHDALHQAETAARRLLADLRAPQPAQPATAPEPFGFARDLDGTSLDSSAERAEPYADRPDPYDDD